MKQIAMVDLIGQFKGIEDDVMHAFKEILNSASFINGPTVKSLSANLAKYLNVNHALPCANGTDAIQIALMALNCQPGDEVITTPFTFVATAEVIALLGLKPVFVDVEYGTYNMDANLLQSAINDKSHTIIPVHLFGQGCNMDSIMEVANNNNLKVVEDNAQSIGSSFTGISGTKTAYGAVGHIGTTSFYPAKNLGAYGDAGALFTNDGELAAQIQLVTNHGSNRRYYYDAIGVNSRLDSLQAAVLDLKLAKLDQYILNRQKAAAYYDNELAEVEGLLIPERASYSEHVFHQYTMRITNGKRDELKEHLSNHKIPSMIYYPVPLHLSSAYAKYGYSKGDFPVSEKLAEEVISLPMHTELEEEQLQYITKTVKEFFS